MLPITSVQTAKVRWNENLSNALVSRRLSEIYVAKTNCRHVMNCYFLRSADALGCINLGIMAMLSDTISRSIANHINNRDHPELEGHKEDLNHLNIYQHMYVYQVCTQNKGQRIKYPKLFTVFLLIIDRRTETSRKLLDKTTSSQTAANNVNTDKIPNSPCLNFYKKVANFTASGASQVPL